MKNTLFILSVITSLNVYSQSDTTIYFTNLLQTTDSKQIAAYYEEFTQKSKGSFVLQSYYKENDKWIKGDKSKILQISDTSYQIISSTGTAIRNVRVKGNKYFVQEFESGKLKSEGTCTVVFPLVREGSWNDYDPENGRLTRDEEFHNNRLITNRYWINKMNYIPDVFYRVDSLPIFGKDDSDLYRFIYNNIKYPSDALANKITGKVILKFIVMTDGSIAAVEIVKRSNPLLNAEALRVVRNIPPNWKPGIIDGKKVNTAMSLPIHFDLK